MMDDSKNATIKYKVVPMTVQPVGLSLQCPDDSTMSRPNSTMLR
jgi:hypothetical protein